MRCCALHAEESYTQHSCGLFLARSLSHTHTHRLTHVFSSTCTMDFGVEPYNFEPEYSESELRDRKIDEAVEVHEEAECRCGGRCQFDIAIVEEEKNCCCDNNLCIPSLGDCSCITEHQYFPLIV